MGEVENQIKQVEVSIEQAKSAIDRMKILERLTDNPDFISIIREGYFKDESIRLVILKSDHNMQDDENQANIVKDIDSIGRLNAYFNAIMQIGFTAERALQADEATREELYAEAV